MITDIYSKRLKRENGEFNDVYCYNTIPQKLRNNIIHIWTSSIGRFECWDSVQETLLREYGELELVKNSSRNTIENCGNFLMTITSVEKFIDIIELTFSIIDTTIREMESWSYEAYKISQSPDDAIKELNHRCKEHQFGYEYIDGYIIRIDREFTHNEMIKPAIKLLYEEGFESPCDEFLNAHQQYREGCVKSNPEEDYMQAIINCNKAFESTMKIICERKLELVPRYNTKHTASDLITDLIEGNILPNHMEHTFHGLKNIIKGITSSLKEGLPVIRNKVGHGKGEEIRCVPEEFVTYAINLCASNIVLLVNIYKSIE